MSFPPDSTHPGDGSAPSALAALRHALQDHNQLCGEIMAVIQQEHQQLKAGTVNARTKLQAGREGMLESLSQKQGAIAEHREAWMRLTDAERKQHPDIAGALKQSTDLIMKIVSLDRENEQLMLRNKLVPPSHLPPAQRQNPNLVAKLYKDQP